MNFIQKMEKLLDNMDQTVSCVNLYKKLTWVRHHIIQTYAFSKRYSVVTFLTETCTFLNDVDLPGHDIHCRGSPSAQDCAQRCYNNSACKSWTFIPKHYFRHNSASTCCEKRKQYSDSWRVIRSKLISGTKNCGDSANTGTSLLIHFYTFSLDFSPQPLTHM